MFHTRIPIDLASGDAAALQRALLRHPGVKSAAVFSQAGRLLALVVPDDSYLDESLLRTAAATMTIRKWQKTYDLNQSSSAAVSAPPGFNTAGWDSSFTRRALPVQDMHEWVNTSVDSILRLGARSIYEIGCGSGLLLMRIAPQCDRYVAVDFSHEALARVREQLQSLPAAASRVQLFERPADNFAGLEPRSFDAVVINSAAQYFPNSGYLTRVLQNAVGLVRDGGHVFVGDVRSLPLLPTFAASVELFQAEDDLPVAELRERVRRRLRHTPELVLAPAWFLALRSQLDRVAHVEIVLRRGRADNEMTRYRYNAVLHIGQESQPALVPCDPASGDPIAQIRTRLQQSREPFVISSIPNARVEEDTLALAAIAASDPAPAVAALRQELRASHRRGIHPQDLFDLEAAHPGLRIHLSWAASRSDGSYDALVVPAGHSPAAFETPGPAPSASLRLANSPGQAALRAQLTERLLAHGREHLPDSVIFDRLVLVDDLPASLDPGACAELPSLEDPLVIP